MDDVIKGLGYRPGTATRLALGVAVAGFSLLLAVLPHVVLRGVSPVIVQATIAALWCYWLGWIFPRQWEAQLARHGHARAYRAAFLSGILPGVCGNFAQILRPAFYGVLAGWPALSWSPGTVAGLVLVMSGGALIVLALRVIGIGGAMFVWEYRLAQPSLTARGIYGVVRHPLFAGGVTVSLGLALLMGGTVPLMMAAVNVASVPPFLWAERRRLTLVFGDRFRRYRADVPAVIPRFSSFAAPSSGLPVEAAVAIEPDVPADAAFAPAEVAKSDDRFHAVG